MMVLSWIGVPQGCATDAKAASPKLFRIKFQGISLTGKTLLLSGIHEMRIVIISQPPSNL
jgi:hypothetical protein